jgi:nucleoside diphosphate kinase
MITRRQPIEDFCFAIIKHDALANGEQLILRRLDEAGVTICARKDIVITPSQLDEIYEDALEKPYYIPMRNSIAGRKAICLIIGGSGGVADTIEALKGGADKSGTIRGDLSYIDQMSNEQYQAFLNGTYTHHAVTGRTIHDHIYMDDRFHSSGAGDETRRGIGAVFSPAEIAGIGAHYPSFARFMAATKR